MKQRGKRIRPSGKDLVFHFTIASLLPVFLLVVGLFHVKTIQQINWQDFNLSQADKIDIPYLIISFSVAILICLLVAFVFKRVRYDTVKQLYHRQKLAKMILENKWYESEQVKTEGFFKDSAGRTKEKITYFPKMYYRLKNGLIQIRVEITLGKYQDQLLHLEKKLESGLYCELTDKELKDSYV
ncbi:ATP-binding protein, partial [Streptococcus pneumoniae]